MIDNQTEICLSINLQGSLSSRGEYSHYHRVEKNGFETNGVKIERLPVFTKCKKTVHLGTEFVKGALEEAPLYLHMRPQIWRKIPQLKRIAIHVSSYVKAVHPEHRGYELEIL